VEVAGMMNWKNAAPTKNGAPHRVGEDKWEADVAHLSSCTTYDIRIRGCNVAGEGMWTQVEPIKSSEPPQAPYDVQTVYQQTNSVSLEWLIDDPDGAEVITCEVQIGSALSWKTIMFVDGKAPRRVQDTKWEGVIPDLCPNTTYGVRVRGRNLAGDGVWKQQQIQTVHSPLTPGDIICSSPFPGALSLEWRVVDWRFCSVDKCDIEVGGALSWFPAVFNADAGPRRFQDHIWRACLIELTPGALCKVRIRSSNKAGYSGWRTGESQVLGVPAPPVVVTQVEWAMNKMVVEWDVPNDTDEIFGYEVQASTGCCWGEPKYENEIDAPRRFKDNVWRATLSEMEQIFVQSIRIRGYNRAGPGRWSDTMQFMVKSELEKAPGFCCLRTNALPN